AESQHRSAEWFPDCWHAPCSKCPAGNFASCLSARKGRRRGCGRNPAGKGGPMGQQGFTLTCDSFAEGGSIPAAHTCEGRNRSPRLQWMHPPEGTKSFVLIVDDPDAPRGTFTHWVLFDIPAETRELPEGVSGIGIG